MSTWSSCTKIVSNNRNQLVTTVLEYGPVTMEKTVEGRS